MSRVINEIPSDRLYPWDEWMDGQARSLIKGEDFECDTVSMVSVIYQQARRHGRTVKIARRGQTVMFRFSISRKDSSR